MPFPNLLDIDTSARRILTIVLGLVEIGLGAVRINQGLERKDLVAVLDGLKAIVYGLNAIFRGWRAEGTTWAELGGETCHLISLYIRIRGVAYFLEGFQALIGQGEQA
jgi:hypothetical protein